MVQSKDDIYLYEQYEDTYDINKTLNKYLYSSHATSTYNSKTIYIGVVKTNIDNYIKSQLDMVLNCNVKIDVIFEMSEILEYNDGDKYLKVVASNTINNANKILSSDTVDSKGKKYYSKMLDDISKTGESIGIFYLKRPDTGYIESIVSYGKLYERYNLVVGTGLYKEEIDILAKNNISDFENTLNMQLRWIIATTIALISVIIVLLITVFNFMKKKQIRLLKIENKVMEKHYKIIEKKYDETNKIIHDFKNLTIVIKGLINKGNIKELEEYIEKVYSNTNSLQRTIITNNKVIDIILNEKIGTMDDSKIEFKYNIEYVDLSHIDNVDMSIIIGNLLDNAIESCNKSEDKLINLNIYKFNSFINVIKITNSCDHEPIIIDNKFISSKLNKEYHGYGTKNVKEILKKYNANITFKYNKEMKLFEVIVMIPKSASK